MATAKCCAMNSNFDSNEQLKFSPGISSLWERILNADELDGCGNLEKLLAGCEVIAALDGCDLLAA